MAEMRLRARPSALLAGLLLVAFPAYAAAEPHPIAKPSKIAPIQPTKAPVSTQPSSPPSPPAKTVTPPAKTVTPPADTTTPPPTTGKPTGLNPGGTTGSTGTNGATHNVPVKTVVAVSSEGGRDDSGIAVPAPPPPQPTPLGVVAAGDRVTEPGTSTPPWKIALLALLAAAEAFLLVRLVRNRPPGELSPAS